MNPQQTIRASVLLRLRSHAITLLPAVLSTSMSLAGTSIAEVATPANLLVDSAGINIHLSFLDTLYSRNFPLILSSLQALNIHHVRDGLVLPPPANGYYERHRELAAHGVGTDLVTSIDQTPAMLADAVAAMSPAIEYLEAPNEYDQKGSDWSQRLVPYVRDLAASARKPNTPLSLPLIGPSLTRMENYKTLGDVSAYSDIANLHNYFGGHHPGTGGWGANAYGSIGWNLKNIGVTNPGQPIFTTETGYTNQSGKDGYVPEAIAARYLPRLLLEQWGRGIKRTYLYELLSSAGEDYGLLHPDGSRKPSFTAVASLLQLLNDPGKVLKPHALDYAVTGSSPDLHHLLLEKSDGTFLLALWIEASGYDVNAKKMLNVPGSEVQVTFRTPVKRIAAISFADTGLTSTHEIGAKQTVTQQVTDNLTILQINPGPRRPN